MTRISPATVIAERPDPIGQRLVVGDHGSSVAKRAKILARVKLKQPAT